MLKLILSHGANNNKTSKKTRVMLTVTGAARGSLSSREGLRPDRTLLPAPVGTALSTRTFPARVSQP